MVKFEHNGETFVLAEQTDAEKSGPRSCEGCAFDWDEKGCRDAPMDCVTRETVHFVWRRMQ